MRKTLIPLVALLVLTILVFADCSSEEVTPTPVGEGTVAGTVSIGPLCPVEPCTNPVNPYTELQVVVLDGDDEAAVIDVNEDGSFSGSSPAGAYEVTLRPCEWLGCQSALPVAVIVRNGEVETLTLTIDTGIR